MILELYDSLTRYVFLNAPCNQFLAVENLRDTPCTSNSGCPDHFFFSRREMNSKNMLWTTESSGLHAQKYSKYHRRTVVELLLP
jgi:hypothetical protein